ALDLVNDARIGVKGDFPTGTFGPPAPIDILEIVHLLVEEAHALEGIASHTETGAGHPVAVERLLVVLVHHQMAAIPRVLRPELLKGAAPHDDRGKIVEAFDVAFQLPVEPHRVPTASGQIPV